MWGWLSALSLVDQSLASGAGFGVNLLLARWMVPDVYGAFAVAFAGFLFVSGFHNVLLLEPMSVMGPSRHAGNLPAYFRAQMVVHAVLVGALSGVSLLGGLLLWKVVPASPLAGAVIGGSLALPFLLLAWLARRMCYVMRRPALAIQGSAFYLGFVGVGLFVLAHFGWLDPFSAFVLMGCGSLTSAGLLLLRLGLWSHGKDDAEISWSTGLAENWKYGKWLLMSTVLYSISSQTQMFLVAGMLGLSAAGVLRAMQLPSLVMAQVVTAAGMLILPALSRDYGRGAIQELKHKATLASAGLAGLACCFALLLAMGAGRLEHLLFGGRYAAHAWLMPLLALVPAAGGFYQGFSMALRSSRRPYFDLVANGIAAPVGLVSALIFVHLWGLAGAGASLVASMLALAMVSFVCFLHSRWSSPAAASLGVPS